MEALLSIPSDDPVALTRVSAHLEGLLRAAGAPRRRVVFACIGTDRSTGDALGPLVGQKLVRLGLATDDVLGTLEHPLHAMNLADRLAPLLGAIPRPLVIAVDAALGAVASVGSIHLRPGGLRPGQGVGKDLCEVGEVSITGTVNVNAGTLDAQVLQSTRLFLVQGMAETIGTALWWALRSLAREEQGAERVPAAAAA